MFSLQILIAARFPFAVACAGHVRGACIAVRAIAAGVDPAEAITMTADEVNKVAPPKAADGSFVAGMKDVKAALGAACDANVMQSLEDKASLYLQTMDEPELQHLKIVLMDTRYENDPEAQHLMLVVPTDKALAQAGVTTREHVLQNAPALPLIFGETVFESHALNENPEGPITLSPVVKGLENGKEDPEFPLTALRAVTLADNAEQENSPSKVGIGLLGELQQDPAKLQIIVGSGKGSPVSIPVFSPSGGFTCNHGVSIILLDTIIPPEGFLVGNGKKNENGGAAGPVGEPAIILLRENASALSGPAAAPSPANTSPSPAPTPVSAAASLLPGAAALVATTLAALI